MREMGKLVLALLVAMPFLMGGSCNQSIVRDKTVFEAEVNLAEQMAVQPAEKLMADLVGDIDLSACTCEEGEWTTPECEATAKLILTVITRAPYHKAMALYNAGITDERPPKEAPEIPAPGTLCPTNAVDVTLSVGP